MEALDLTKRAKSKLALQPEWSSALQAEVRFGYLVVLTAVHFIQVYERQRKVQFTPIAADRPNNKTRGETLYRTSPRVLAGHSLLLAACGRELSFPRSSQVDPN